MFLGIKAFRLGLILKTTIKLRPWSEEKGMTARLIVLSVFFLFTSKTSFADIYTPVNVQLDLNEFSSVLNRYFSKGIKVSEKLLEVPKIKGLTAEFANINYEADILPNFTVNSEGQFLIDTEIPMAYFQLDQIKINHKMIKKVGSTKININTSIQCDSLKISLKEKINLKANLVFLKGRPEIQNVVLPDNLDFNVEGDNCFGPKDFEIFLPDIALEWLSSDEGHTQILKFINEEIVSAFWSSIKKGLEINFLGRTIFIALLDIKNTKDNSKVNLMIRWPKEDKFFLNLKDPDTKSNFAIKSSDFNDVLKSWVIGGCFNLNFKRSEISGIEKLFENRFYQLFVWNDLMNFNTKANFNLKIRICVNDIEINKTSSNEIKFKHNSNVYMQMNFLGAGNKELPYMFFWSKADGFMNLRTTKEGLKFNLSDSKFNFKYKYHPDMMKWRKSTPSGGPALSTILSFVLPELETTNISVLDDFKEIFINQKINFDSKNYLELND
jgi:hypothetical protein